MQLGRERQRILVGVDFSPESDAAIRAAIGFARAFDATITLLHVHELPTMMNGIVPGADSTTDAEEIRDAAQAQLDELVTRLRASDPRALEGGISILTEVEGGQPAHVILERARSGRFDLVVLGTHGRSGLQRLLVGSVAEAVIRGATCPVLTVHLPAAIA